MLFNSYVFIFAFMPIVFAGTILLGRYSHHLAALWLGLASLTFYAAWDSGFVLLLLTSICFNYGAGYLLGHKDIRQAKLVLAGAIGLNLALLGYFKYANFFINSTNGLFGFHIPGLDIILPLGISFFTFTQIAFLVDTYRGLAREYNFIHYLLFVTYFPHLIAGPIIHHKQLMPQFARPETYRINIDNIAVGLSIFILGLAKKVLIADQLAGYATPVFSAAAGGSDLMFFEAWAGALAYTLQLYFDFSGYCDMAIGISLMLNIRLPMNFNSPYKATSIIDFWRRWHMTLSTFLRDYLYFPLGGNRKGVLRRYINLMVTMLLGGLWHGAGWTFIIWGGLHGIYLMINHAWREIKGRLGWGDAGVIGRFFAGALTFLAVVVAWVFFRAESFSGAFTLLAGMSGLHGISLPGSFAGHLAFLSVDEARPFVIFNGLFPVTAPGTGKVLGMIAVGLAIVWLLPNAREIFYAYKSTWEDTTSPGPLPRKSMTGLYWKPRAAYAVATGLLFSICVLYLNNPSEFLYFQF